MLSAFLDASGRHSGAHVVVVTGLIADPGVWDHLNDAWRAILSGEGLPDFHASDCATGGGKFKDRDIWPAARRTDLNLRLAELIAKAAQYRVWGALVLDDHRAVFDDPNTELAFALCAGMCAMQASTRGLICGELVAYTFDQGEKHSGYAYSALKQMKQEMPDSYIAYLGDGDRRLIPALQAADLHNYEIYRYFSDQILSLMDGKQRSERPAFPVLLGVAEAYGGAVLVGESLEQIKAIMASHGGPAVYTPMQLAWRPRLARRDGSLSLGP